MARPPEILVVAHIQWESVVEASNPVIALLIAHMVLVPMMACLRGPSAMARLASRGFELLKRLGIHQSWFAFVGSRLDHTATAWLRFEYADGTHDDGLSPLRSLPDPHQVYIRHCLRADPAQREAILDALIEHVRIAPDAPTPVAASVVVRTRLVQAGASGATIQEREGVIATLELGDA